VEAAMEKIDPHLPVKELLARHPEIRPVLAAFDIDTCCGGEHPLAMACRARGLELDDILREIEQISQPDPPKTPPEAFAAMIVPSQSIREIVRRYSSAAAVLERHGLGDCGGESGPEEPLGWFATVHRVALEPLLADLRSAAAADVRRLPVAAVSRPPARPFSPEFLIGSLLFTLTLGATTGMINLLRIAAGGEVPFSHRQMHAHTQILGFAALFLMGIAFHALPRITGVGGGPPRFSKLAFWLMAGGVLLRNLGQPFNFAPIGRAASLLSGIAELSAGCLFAIFVADLIRRARSGKYPSRDPFLAFLGFGSAFFLAALLLNAAQSVWLAGHLETALPAALVEPFYFAALYGFLLAWIFGFSHRVVALFLGLDAPAPAPAWAALTLQTLGITAFLAAWIPGLSNGAAGILRDTGITGAALSAIVLVIGAKLLSRPKLPALAPRGNPLFAIRAAYVCLMLWAVLQLAAVGVARMTPLPAQNPWWNDAARHVFTVGFLTLLIVGMSFRILPVFSGKTLWSSKLAFATYALILGGVAMRLLQYPAAFRAKLYEAGSWMGVLVVAALILFTVNLVKTMRAKLAPR
jgi:iron-sulfur cluster repair protein YtfE (RIC family)